MTYNLPEFKNELQSEYHLFNCFLIMCLLNDGLLVASCRSELGAVAVAKLKRSLPLSSVYMYTSYIIYLFSLHPIFIYQVTMLFVYASRCSNLFVY